MLNECIHDEYQPEDLLTEEAIVVLAEQLAMPLQVKYYLELSCEEAYKAGQEPIGADIIQTVLATGLNDLEPHLSRHGYNAKVLAELLNVRTAEVRSFLHGQLPTGRSQNLKDQMRKMGIPV